MGAREKKKKINLQEMPECEKIQLIKEVKEKLRQSVMEAKLWQSLLEAENLIVNGQTIFQEQEPLTGLNLKDEIYR
ncbi:MAG: hypothetical protein K6T73_10885 [Candidatus Bathyarchaeota archaeon]|nr:hypothetical protein [Candidatus Bathyarchaeota archaeon]